MTHSLPNSLPPQDDISLIDLVRGLAKTVRDLLIHWKGISFSILIAGLLSLLWYTRQDPVYPATLSFILADDNNSQMANFSAVFSQLGIPMGSGKYNVDKLMEIAKSRRIVQEALFQQCTVDGRQDYTANHLINQYDLPAKWAKKRPEMSGFAFAHANSESFNEQENWALKSLYQLLIGSPDHPGIFSTDYGKTDYVMYLKLEGIEPEVSIQFINDVYDALEGFFYNNANKRQQESFMLLTQKRDSISSALTNVNATLSRNIDRNLGAIDLTSGNYNQRLRTEQLILQSALAKAEEHLNIAEIAMRSHAPLIQLIDRPLGPISPVRPRILRIALLSLALGLALYMVFAFAKLVIQTK